MENISDQWQTPDWLFEELNKEFQFDIDLCATKENSKCPIWYNDYLKNKCEGTRKDGCYVRGIGYVDALSNAFMNPPYSNPRPFIEKAWEDSKHCKIVCLVKCDPSTKWWATFWNYEDVFLDGGLCALEGPKPGCEVRFFPKRIKFDPPKGFTGKTSGPSFPSALIIMDRRKM